MKRKITLITGSRAEWGLLLPLWQLLQSSPEVQVGLVVTGSHLDNFGDNSIREILADEAQITASLDIFSSYPETAGGNGKMFHGISEIYLQLPEILTTDKPDLVVILGDRYEIFAVASVCRLIGLPLAHISGGELTFGAFDDCLRHCISKLSDLHFTATEEYRQRVIQLGESPKTVFNVGEPGLFQFSRQELFSRSYLANDLKINLNKRFALFTFHPETCFPEKVSGNMEMVVSTILTAAPDLLLVFTSSNSDPEGDQINSKLEGLAEEFPERIYPVKSLGRKKYLSLAKLSEFVGGNSSSGIVEIPALHVPVINFGSRQTGRPHGEGVIDVELEKCEIEKAVKLVMTKEFKEKAMSASSPYDGENSIELIGQILINTNLKKIPRAKGFFDLP